MRDVLDFWALFQPLPRQVSFLRAARESRYVLYGGARGGGKSKLLRWGLLWAVLEFYLRDGLKNVRVALFSEDYPTLKDRQIGKIKTEFPLELGSLKATQDEGLGFYLNEEYGGGAILLRNLDEPAKYQSAEFAGIAVEELTKNPIDTFDVLRGSLRWPGVSHTFFWGATNPGSIGHLWVKQLWIDRDYTGDFARFAPLASQFRFIQSLPKDNPYLDQTYWDELNSLPEGLRRAWVEGDWDVFEGQAFPEWSRDAHVTEAEVPPNWRWTGGGDWGYTSPGVLYLMATGPERSIVRHEYVFKGTEPYRVGYLFGQQIMRFHRPEWISIDTPAVPDGGPTILEELQRGMKDATAPHQPPPFVNPPKGKGSRYTKKQLLHEALRFIRSDDGTVAPWALPKLQFHTSCRYAIRTLPALPVSETDSEDVDTDSDDHAYDGVTSWLMARTPAVERKSRKNEHPDDHPGFDPETHVRKDVARKYEEAGGGSRWSRYAEE